MIWKWTKISIWDQYIFFYIIKLLLIYIYHVSYSWPNGWTKLAELFWGNAWVPWAKKYFIYLDMSVNTVVNEHILVPISIRHLEQSLPILSPGTLSAHRDTVYNIYRLYLVHIVHTIHSSSFRGVHRGVGMGRGEG